MTSLVMAAFSAMGWVEHVDHDAGEAQFQRLHADVKVGAVVQMDGHRHIHLVCAPLGDLHKEVVARVGTGGDVVGQDHGAAHLLGRLAAGADDVVVAALGVDGRNGVAFPGRLFHGIQIGGQHKYFPFLWFQRWISP